MILNRYAYFLNQLRISSNCRNYYFDVQITKQTKQLVILLQNLNIIRRFYKLNPKTSVYRVFPSYSRYRKYSRRFTLYSKLNGRLILTYKTLRILDINAPHSYYVVDTPNGVLTQKEAIRLRIGGKLIMIIH